LPYAVIDHKDGFRIRCLRFSATDYSYLVNNGLGWMSDDYVWYEFDDLQQAYQMQDYLVMNSSGEFYIG
jgi:hypothetical protein